MFGGEGEMFMEWVRKLALIRAGALGRGRNGGVWQVLAGGVGLIGEGVADCGCIILYRFVSA